jgi:hypothetical protein
MACIAGGIAAAHYGLAPAALLRQVRARLPRELIDLLDAFDRRYAFGG